ncbi:hypothetical protein H8K47_08010 [Undibacterium sp. CY7W]|uniref:Uncharacterized protein n=1 Tax=Undibacterium rugosum TaxID=2762291 RepID=A0A923KZL4_9BURK|nr:hypothetical protein [Undibacterium rugosum]MBC3935301.1 hypothetical protein [Undibacterium rugosum]
MYIQTLIPDPGSPWFFIFFLAMWFAITGLLSTLSGWRSMATHWRARGQNSGNTYRFVSGTMGAKSFPVGYGSCLTITVSEQGLGLAVLLPFRFMSPPIFIPWSQITSVTEGKTLFIRHVLIQPHNHWTRIKLHGQVVEQILSSSSGHLGNAA